MPVKIDTTDGERLRLRTHVTAAQGELDIEAINRGHTELMEAIPPTHEYLYLRVRHEHNTRGRENSRRIFLVMIAEQRPR